MDFSTICTPPVEDVRSQHNLYHVEFPSRFPPTLRNSACVFHLNPVEFHNFPWKCSIPVEFRYEKSINHKEYHTILKYYNQMEIRYPQQGVYNFFLEKPINDTKHLLYVRKLAVPIKSLLENQSNHPHKLVMLSLP